jgi:hypothetical protein
LIGNLKIAFRTDFQTFANLICFHFEGFRGKSLNVFSDFLFGKVAQFLRLQGKKNDTKNLLFLQKLWMFKAWFKEG